jgi:hypothetical protein
MAHPTVKAADAFTYQSWPIDRTEEWTEKFIQSSIARTSWRTIALNPAIQNIIAIVAIAKRGIFYPKLVANLPSDADMLVEGITSIKGKQKASSRSDSSLLPVRTN